MVIPVDALIELLTKYGRDYFKGVSPREALYVAYSDKRQAADTITYETTDGGTLAIDVDSNGIVLGIELL